ncbi:MAG: hypothetical protein PHU69_05770 [Fermentimonas sp.]|nr:hypothetical protein [Fermentimonas sp.]
MKEIQEINFERNNEISATGGETAIDTQAEVDLISAGIGFDEVVHEDINRSERQDNLRTSKR